MTIDVDTIRALVGDTDEATQLLDEDTMALIIAPYSSTYLAAAAVADAIAAKFSRKVDFSLEGLRFSNSQKAKAYLELGQRLRVQANNDDSSTIGMSITGTSRGEMQAVVSDDDRVQGLFEVGMQQDPAVRGHSDEK